MDPPRPGSVRAVREPHVGRSPFQGKCGRVAGLSAGSAAVDQAITHIGCAEGSVRQQSIDQWPADYAGRTSDENTYTSSNLFRGLPARRLRGTSVTLQRNVTSQPEQTPIARPAQEDRARGHQDQSTVIGSFATVAGAPPPDGDHGCADTHNDG